MPIGKESRRPFGLTFVALVLGWLSLAGFLSAIVWPFALSQLSPPHTDEVHLLREFQEKMSSVLVPFVACAILYGATAAWAAITAWRVDRRAPKAFLAWSGSVVVMFLLMPKVGLPADQAFWMLAGFLGFVVALLGIGYVYISNAVQRSHA